MLEFLVFASLILITCFICVILIRLKNKNLELILVLDETIKSIETIKNNYGSDLLIEKEHLISFLSESRDIAYKYIEDLHDALIEYENEIKFDLEKPNDLSISRFRSAFEKLKKFYPENIPND
jgi:hypothetical protein